MQQPNSGRRARSTKSAPLFLSRVKHETRDVRVRDSVVVGVGSRGE